MDIILTHEQADFDAAGSVLAAWLLDPARIPILPKKRNRNLAAFLEDYKTRLPFFTWQTAPKGSINRVYITDTQNIAAHSRLAGVKDVVVWDHHPHRHIFPDREENIYDPTGACTTFLVEKLAEKPDIHPGRIFSTLMLMGIYEDTGSLSYGSTTPRDIRAAAWLVEKGADLDLMRRYVLQPMTDHQQQGTERLLQTLETYRIKGKQIVIASADIREISDEFSAVAHQLRDMLNPDGLILLLAVKTGIRLICRATTDDIDFGAMMSSLNGGGHARAASGLITVEDMEGCSADILLSDARETVLSILPEYIRDPEKKLAEKLNAGMAPEQLKLLKIAADTAEHLDMPAYLVGGVVRDLLLGYPVMDFDIVVEGDAIRLGKMIAERYGGKLSLHSQFFTAKWIPEDGSPLDLISARSETYAGPAALPEVAMSGMEADLRRRDFTLNTLAIRLDGEHYGELTDICGGLQDLNEQLIRTLHNRSFIDDPTRLFRAVRFEQRFDFEFEPDTLRQAREQLSWISMLTGQRIWHELRLFCAEPYPEACFARIVQMGIASQIDSGLVWNDGIEEDCVRFRTADSDILKKLDAVTDPEKRMSEGLLWTWLSALPGKTISVLCERLLLSGKTAAAVKGTARMREEFPSCTAQSPSLITSFLETVPLESICCYAQFTSKTTERERLLDYLTAWRFIKPYASGETLLRSGIEAGPRIGQILTELRSAWLDGVITSEEEENAWLEQHRQKAL